MTRRSRRRINSSTPGLPEHTSKEWLFLRRLVLLCPGAGHVIGHVRDDAGGTFISGDARFAGPAENEQRTIHWTCTRCDQAAIKSGGLARTGKHRRHEGRVSAAALGALLEAMKSEGPDKARVALDARSITDLTARVITGDQLRAVQQAEAARIRRHRGPDYDGPRGYFPGLNTPE